MSERRYTSHDSRLRQAAYAHGLTLKALAFRADVSYPQVMRYHHGIAPPDVAQGLALARAVGVHPRDVHPDLVGRMKSRINETEQRISRVKSLISQHAKTLERLEESLSRDLAEFGRFLEDT
jgi:transcriptional regulator with XRE-family HTH domain